MTFLHKQFLVKCSRQTLVFKKMMLSAQDWSWIGAFTEGTEITTEI
jgi:hypothetical protein